jgi:hypothetical protein
MSHLAITALHSLVEGVTVGATAKLVRGSLASGMATVDSWDEGFDRADTFEGEGKTTADIDVGVLATRGRARVGVVLRNLSTPTFESAASSVKVPRHVRVGAAWGDLSPASSRLLVAVDADLTRVPHVDGERRDVAAGAERWFRRQSVAVRGGFRASTVGDVRPIASAGASYAVRSGLYVDVYAAAGRDADRRWGIAGRLTY